MIGTKKQALDAIRSFNGENMRWDLRESMDNNRTDADVVILRPYSNSMSSFLGIGKIIIASTSSFEECEEEYQYYWEYILRGTHDRVKKGLVDYATYQYKNVTYYLLID